MSEPPRDWDREMAEIDRLAAKQGSVPPGASVPVPAGRPAAPVGAGPARRRSVALTWFWVLLAIALAVALPLWPYQRGCGLQLFFFLGATGVTALIALLGALASWASRRAVAHVLSLLVLLWAGAVALREVLPRVGYAKTSHAWMCTTEPAAPAGTAPTGTASTGTAPTETAPTGTAPTGTAPTGTAPAGTAPAGAAPTPGAP
jgi:hypothetical protein